MHRFLTIILPFFSEFCSKFPLCTDSSARSLGERYRGYKVSVLTWELVSSCTVCIELMFATMDVCNDKRHMYEMPAMCMILKTLHATILWLKNEATDQGYIHFYIVLHVLGLIWSTKRRRLTSLVILVLGKNSLISVSGTRRQNWRRIFCKYSKHSSHIVWRKTTGTIVRINYFITLSLDKTVTANVSKD